MPEKEVEKTKLHLDIHFNISFMLYVHCAEIKNLSFLQLQGNNGQVNHWKSFAEKASKQEREEEGRKEGRERRGRKERKREERRKEEKQEEEERKGGGGKEGKSTITKR